MKTEVINDSMYQSTSLSFSNLTTLHLINQNKNDNDADRYIEMLITSVSI